MMDVEKTTFITPRGTYCYQVMPFSLKNARATYQRMVSKVLQKELGDIMEVYINDMLMKSKFAEDHLGHLGKVFAILKAHKLQLNAKKCAFGVGSGKFLEYLAESRRTPINSTPSRSSKLPRPSGRSKGSRECRHPLTASSANPPTPAACRPFFESIKTSKRAFQWNAECDKALAELKEYMEKAPVLVTPREDEDLFLYLAVFEHAVSSALVRQEGLDQQPIYILARRCF